MVSPVGFGSGVPLALPVAASSSSPATTDSAMMSPPESVEDRLKLADELVARAAERAKPEDVGALSVQQAKGRYDQIKLMEKYNVFQHMGVNAVYMGEKANSLDTYMGWLEQRFSGDPGSPQAPEAAAPRASSADSALPTGKDAADLPPAPSRQGRGGEVEGSGDATSPGTGFLPAPSGDDLTGVKAGDRAAPSNGSTYASIARAQAAAATASQVVAELSKLAARARVSDRPVDVGALSPESAKSQHEQLTVLRRLGTPFLNIGLAAIFGDQGTTDVGKLVDLLNSHGVDGVQDPATARPSFLNFQV